MQLSDYQQPDYITINRYRSKYFVDMLPSILTQLILHIASKGLLDLYDVHFIDGTKIKADANKKIVWKKNVKRFKQPVNTRVRNKLKEIDELDEEEMKQNISKWL